MHIQLRRKLALRIDGVDVSSVRVGDVLDLPTHDAELLIAEGWATLMSGRVRATRPRRGIRQTAGARSHFAMTADAPRQVVRTLDHLRELRRQREQRCLQAAEQRRIEDLVREELRDSRARTISPGSDNGPAGDSRTGSPAR